MMTFSQPKLEIIKVDNGYVIEWRDESRQKNGFSALPPVPTTGVVICKDKAAALAYVEQFFK